MADLFGLPPQLLTAVLSRARTEGQPLRRVIADGAASAAVASELVILLGEHCFGKGR